MPLSEDEEKILAQIEAGIRKTDPNLAQQVEQSTVYRHSGRRSIFSVIGIVALLVVILFTFSTPLWPIAFVSFGLMVIVGILFVENIVKIGRAGVDDAIKQANRMNPTGSWKGRKSS